VFIGLDLVMLELGFLEYKHWISVNWTVTENQSSAILTHLVNNIATVTQHMNHEIPIGIGLLGFAQFFLDSIRARNDIKVSLGWKRETMRLCFFQLLF